MTTIYISHEDENQDGITNMLRVYSDGFGSEPLIGDYRGIALAEIHYIPCRRESVERAEEIAMHIVNGEVANGATFDAGRGDKFKSYFPMWNTENILEREA